MRRIIKKILLIYTGIKQYNNNRNENCITGIFGKKK